MATQYLYCKTVDDLCNHITYIINKSLTLEIGHPRTVIEYPIKFCVEDTPTEKHWADMSSKQKRYAFADATGFYGITDVGEQFDSESILLVGAYYGSNNIQTSRLLDNDSTEEEVEEAVNTLVDGLLFCEDMRSNIILQITTKEIK